MAISNWYKGSMAVVAIIALIALVSFEPVFAQDVYKTVDENGNTVYTDQKPSDDAVPVKLKELTVVDPVDLGNEQVVAGEVEAEGEPDPLPDFGLRIVSPTNEETIWNTAYVLSVQVATDHELPPEMRLVYLVDGEARSTTQSTSVDLDEIFRGEHQLSVELRTSEGRTIDTAGPVTFFMRQHSIQHPNPG